MSVSRVPQWWVAPNCCQLWPVFEEVIFRWVIRLASENSDFVQVVVDRGNIAGWTRSPLWNHNWHAGQPSLPLLTLSRLLCFRGFHNISASGMVDFRSPFLLTVTVPIGAISYWVYLIGGTQALHYKMSSQNTIWRLVNVVYVTFHLFYLQNEIDKYNFLIYKFVSNFI